MNKLLDTYGISIQSIEEKLRSSFEQQYPRPDSNAILIVRRREGSRGQATIELGWCEEEVGQLSNSGHDLFWSAVDILQANVDLPENVLFRPSVSLPLEPLYGVEFEIVRVEVWVDAE